MPFRHWFLLGLIATPCVAEALGDSSRVTDFDLGNGMQVVVIEDHRAPVVQHMVWYRVGSADEPMGLSGLAHYLEHLMFKGTDSMAAGEFTTVVEANGGHDNAFTGHDYTAYHQRIAADRLALMMRMEADRMRGLRLTRVDAETERSVVLEERNERTDSEPRALFFEQLNALQYLNHPYGRPIIGWKHEIESLNLDNALAFYNMYYAPNNATLVVSGDVFPEEVHALAERHYGTLPANPDIHTRARPQEPPHRAERRLIYRDSRVAQPMLVRNYLAPERNTGAQEDAAALTLLAELLGGGPTSILPSRLQFDTGEAIYAGASYLGTTVDKGDFRLFVLPAKDVSLESAEAALDRELTAFLDDGIDMQQLARIKAQYRAADIYAQDNVERIANRYGRALAIGLTVADVQAWPETVQSVTPDRIIEAARELLLSGASVTGWLTGDTGGDRI